MTDDQKSVFLSYASQDAAAASRICDALKARGLEVWFDQSELRGGDTWDHQIRQRIKLCSLFIPIISTNSVTRSEGYFRLEWKLGIDRSHLMAPGRTFIVPVAIDTIDKSDERIPDKFREVQWTQLTDGNPTSSFVERIALLAARPEAQFPQRSSSGATSGHMTQISQGATGWRRRLVRSGVVAVLLISCAALAIWATTSAVRRPTASSTPVVPYSAQDRRMTFAVVPFHGPVGDAKGVEAAKANAGAVLAAFQRNSEWGHVITLNESQEIIATHSTVKEAARLLDVHFIVRGTITKAVPGYHVDIDVVDGTTERALGTETLEISADTLLPKSTDDFDDAVAVLLYQALKSEVERAASRPENALDVRDLSFRAYVYWGSHHGPEAKDGYDTAMRLLTRGTSIAPRDIMAWRLIAEVNLCDCIGAWSQDPAAQAAIAQNAVDQLLHINSTSHVSVQRAQIALIRGRFAELLSFADAILKRDPEDLLALQYKIIALIRLGRARESVPYLELLQARNFHNWFSAEITVAAARYALANYAAAADMATSAIGRMNADDLQNRASGPVSLILIAALAQLGNSERMATAVADFHRVVPQVDSLAKARQWIYPTFDLYGFQPLMDGLRRAGFVD